MLLMNLKPHIPQLVSIPVILTLSAFAGTQESPVKPFGVQTSGIADKRPGPRRG